MSTIWNGTLEEAQALSEIINRYCTCNGEGANRTTRCASHTMLLSDQRALDWLLFMRRIAARLRREEYAPSAPPQHEHGPGTPPDRSRRLREPTSGGFPHVRQDIRR